MSIPSWAQDVWDQYSDELLETLEGDTRSSLGRPTIQKVTGISQYKAIQLARMIKQGLFGPVLLEKPANKRAKFEAEEDENSRTVTVKGTGEVTNLDQLIASFRDCEAIDGRKYDPVRTLNVAELGIGFNPKIRKAIGYILTDEKVGGTVHLAFGANRSYGGTSDSIMHWDFVSDPGVNIEIERRSGKNVPVMVKGRLV